MTVPLFIVYVERMNIKGQNIHGFHGRLRFAIRCAADTHSHSLLPSITVDAAPRPRCACACAASPRPLAVAACPQSPRAPPPRLTRPPPRIPGPYSKPPPRVPRENRRTLTGNVANRHGRRAPIGSVLPTRSFQKHPRPDVRLIVVIVVDVSRVAKQIVLGISVCGGRWWLAISWS